MKNKVAWLLFMILFSVTVSAQRKINNLLPVRGLCIAAPTPANVDSFVTFINDELPSHYVNTLILRIDYRYQYKSHPELIDSPALSYDDVKKIVKAAHKNHIRLIPQVNLLGHQSWANKPGKLLAVYPRF